MRRLVFKDVTLYSKCPASKLEPLPMSHLYNRQKLVNDQPWSVECTDSLCCCFDWWELPTWVQHQFVGVDVAREATEAYYRNTRITRLCSDRLDQLTSFLNTDHFNLGAKPADHIRRDELRLSPSSHIKDRSGTSHYFETETGYELFEREMQSLLQIRVKNGFQLIIIVEWRCWYNRT